MPRPGTSSISGTDWVTASASRRTRCRAWAARAPETPLPSPTVFTIEPGIYLDDVTGVRIEDTMFFDAEAGRVERLSMPKGVTVVGS